MRIRAIAGNQLTDDIETPAFQLPQAGPYLQQNWATEGPADSGAEAIESWDSLIGSGLMGCHSSGDALN